MHKLLLKTHAYSNKCWRGLLKPTQIADQYAKFCLKPTRIATNASAPRPAAGAGVAVNVAVGASSVEKHISHALTQLRLARSHARTTRTRNETETDFPIGVNCVAYCPQSPTFHRICSQTNEN